jgi:hypothetical protein
MTLRSRVYWNLDQQKPDHHAHTGTVARSSWCSCPDRAPERDVIGLQLLGTKHMAAD